MLYEDKHSIPLKAEDVIESKALEISSSSPRAPLQIGRLAGRQAFCGPNVRLLGSCWTQHERSNAKGIGILSGSMLGPETNAGFYAGPIQKIAVPVPCRARILEKI